MKKLFLFSVCLLGLALSSCGDKIKPADPAITYQPYKSGWGEYIQEKYVDVPVKDAYEVESVSATVVPDEKYSSLYSVIKATVNVKTVKAPKVDGKSLDGDCTIQLLDENNSVLAESYGHGVTELFNSENGAMTTLYANIGKNWKEDVAKEMLEKVKFIRLAAVGCGYEK